MIKLIQFSKQACTPCKLMRLHINNLMIENKKLNYEYIDIENGTNDYQEALSIIISTTNLRSLPLFCIVEERENDNTVGVIDYFHTRKYEEIDEKIKEYFK